MPDETEWLEYKVNNDSPELIGEYISALSNSATICGHEMAYMLWGINNETHEKDMLANWIEFLKDPESEKVRSLEMTIAEIRQAKDELIRMSNDDTQRELYEMRAKTLKDAVEKGIISKSDLCE